MAAMNEMGDKIRAQLSGWLAPESQGPAAKRPQASSAAAAASAAGKRAEAPSANPFNAEQSAWLGLALTDTLTTFGGHVQKKIEEVETKAQAAHDEVHKLRAELKLEKQGQDARIEKIERHIATTTPSASAAERRPLPSRAEEPQTVARVGNLGWDDSMQTLLQRAADVLREAKVDPASYSAVCAVTSKTGVGSMAEISFRSPSALQTAQLQVKALGKSFVQDRTVWLSPKRSLAETQQAKMVHRIAETLSDIEAIREDPLDVVKSLREKIVRVGTHRVAFIADRKVRWTAWAVQRYAEEDRDMAKAYAESS
jgi:hypothetical protein